MPIRITPIDQVKRGDMLPAGVVSSITQDGSWFTVEYLDAPPSRFHERDSVAVGTERNGVADQLRAVTAVAGRAVVVGDLRNSRLNVTVDRADEGWGAIANALRRVPLDGGES